jgi:hypothetical protein
VQLRSLLWRLPIYWHVGAPYSAETFKNSLGGAQVPSCTESSRARNNGQFCNTTECGVFRGMCKSLSKRAPIIGRDCVRRLIKTEFHHLQAQLTVILKECHFALTTDAWTSISKVGYVTCTVHFIDSAT